MKYFLVTILIFLLPSTIFASVQIGNQQETALHLPLDPYYNYSYSQVIYLQEEIAISGVISAIQYNYSIVGTDFLQDNGDIQIYMGHTAKSQFDNDTDWVPTLEMVKVFDGNWAESDFSNGVPGEGWVTITLDTLFEYNNMDNLVIAFDENIHGYSSNEDEFFCSPVSDARSIEFHSDTDNPNPVNPPESSSTPKFHVANIILEIQEQNPPEAPFNPTPQDMEEFVASTPLLSWECELANEYDVFLDGNLIADNINTTSFQVADSLEQGTPHYWYVKAFNQFGSTTGPTWSFTTSPQAIVEIGNEYLVDQGLPIEPNFAYSYSQTIYEHFHIGMPCLIKSLSYHYIADDNFENSDELVIYMGHTDSVFFWDNTQWVGMNELTEVFNGFWEIAPGSDWVTITLDTPFFYDGQRNLVIAVDENSPGYDSTDDDFFCTLLCGFRSILFRSDGINPDPYDPPDATHLNYAIPNIRLGVADTVVPTENPLELPSKIKLMDNYPNPFNPNTTIAFTIPQDGAHLQGGLHLKLQIYDISGKLIKNLVDGQIEPGYHSVVWNGKNENDEDVASGMYFYTLNINDTYQQTKQMLLLK